MKNISGTLMFDTQPRIVSYASVVGSKEAEGPLGREFDKIIYDVYAGKDTFEQAESQLMNESVQEALKKGGMTAGDVDMALCGDLLNQCVASSFALRGFSIPYVGIYGACSTMALGLMISALAVESGAARTALCSASSHYCTAERQYRTPLEYGSQRPPTAQWTVTGAGTCIVSHADDAPVKIHAAHIGIITDMGVTDPNNMGAAMAPAAAGTIESFLTNSGSSVSDYDAIFTGDLGRVGSRLLYELLDEKGIDVRSVHRDCGVMIYGDGMDVHAGGSGCGCCASVLCSHILSRLSNGVYRNILFIPTGALLSPTTVLQGESIPSIAHLVNLKR